MMEYFLIGIIAGIICGWLILRALINYKLKMVLDGIANTPLPKPELKIIDIDLVKIKDRVYAYDRKDQSFLGHASTKDEMISDLRKRFPNISFMAKTSNLKEVEFHDPV